MRRSGCGGALEALIDDVAIDMLIEWPDRLAHERFQKLRVPLAQFTQMDEGDRVRFLLDEAVRVPAKDPSAGIARFEVMTEIMGLPPFADSERRKVLIEMHGARNLIVHRASVVDRRFLEGCPWVDLNPGERFIVDGNRFRGYCDAVFAYVAHVRESILAERKRREAAHRDDSAEAREVQG